MSQPTIICNHIDVSPLLKAFKKLEEAPSASTELEEEGAIQRFEYTFELFWKTLKRVLAFKGKTVNSPRETFREAAAENLIDGPTIWFEYLELRNLASHTYNEANADKIFAKIPEIIVTMRPALKNLEAL